PGPSTVCTLKAVSSTTFAISFSVICISPLWSSLRSLRSWRETSPIVDGAVRASYGGEVGALVGVFGGGFFVEVHAQARRFGGEEIAILELRRAGHHFVHLLGEEDHLL